MDLADSFDQLSSGTPASAPKSLADSFDQLASKTPPVAAKGKPGDVTGTFGQNFMAGLGKFISDTGTGAKGLVNDLAVSLQNAVPASIRGPIDSANAALGGQAPKDIQSAARADLAEQRVRDAPLMSSGGGMLGNMTGGILSAAALPVTGTMAGAAALGAGIGATQPAESWNERMGNALLGGAAGGATQGASNALGRMLNPNVSSDVKALMDAGVTPTPGQIAGGGWKRAEEALTSVPVLGDSIKAAQGRGIEQLNTAAYNRALSPIGEKLPAGMTGREAVDHVESALSARYDALLPKLSTQADPKFTQDMAGLQGMVANGAIDPTVGASFQRILQNDVLSKFQGQQSITGQTLKDIESDLGQHIKRLGQSTDADQRLVGDALQEAQSSLRSLVQRTNPGAADELSAINTGWANFKRVQAAAGGVGADGGTFTPAQLQSAVRAKDGSKDKGAFARGEALMQDLSDPAKSVLAPKLPDSGTPYRGLMSAMTAAGGAAALGHPIVAAGTALGAALGPAVYSTPAQKLLAKILTERGPGAKFTAQELEYLAPLMAGGAAVGAVSNAPR